MTRSGPGSVRLGKASLGKDEPTNSIIKPPIAVGVADPFESYLMLKKSHCRRYVNLTCLKEKGEIGREVALACHRRFYGVTLIQVAQSIRRWTAYTTCRGESLIPTVSEAFSSLPAFAAELHRHGGAEWGLQTGPLTRRSVIGQVSHVASVMLQVWLDREGQSGSTVQEWIGRGSFVQLSAQAFAGKLMTPESRVIPDEAYTRILQASMREVRSIMANFKLGALPRSADLLPFMIQIAAKTAMNAESLLECQRGCIQPTIMFSQTHSQLEWTKLRSKAKKLQLIVPNVVKDSVSVPELVRFVEKMTAPLVPHVFAALKSDLWLYVVTAADWNRHRVRWVAVDLFDAMSRMLNNARLRQRTMRLPGVASNRSLDPWSLTELHSEASANRTSLAAHPEIIATFRELRKKVLVEQLPAPESAMWLERAREDYLSRRNKAEYFSMASGSNTANAINAFTRRHDLPHFTLADLRPTAATAFIRHGKTLYQLQVLLHHSEPRTTVRYISKELMRPQYRRTISTAQQAIVAFAQPRVVAQQRSSATIDQLAGIANLAAFESGLNDLGTCSCKNPMASPIPGEIAGRLCRAFDSCYFCVHAVWFKEHLPLEIAKLRRWEQLSSSEPHWRAKYEIRCRVIREEILPGFTASDIEWATKIADQAAGLPVLAAAGRTT